MVEEGHPTSRGHAERVAGLAGALTQRLGWPASGVSALRDAAILHHVGKIIVPKSVLLKAGSFTEAEWAQMRTHPIVGDDMLEDILPTRSARGCAVTTSAGTAPATPTAWPQPASPRAPVYSRWPTHGTS